MALPLHAEFRTLPMLFYVPPLLPVMATLKSVDQTEQTKKQHEIGKVWPDNWLYDTSHDEIFGSVEKARFPLKYMASLFSAGDEDKLATVIKKLVAVRMHRRNKTVGDISDEKAKAAALREVGLTTENAEAIYYLTSLAKFDDRFVVPGAHREQAIEMLEFSGDRRGATGFGFKEDSAVRGS